MSLAGFVALASSLSCASFYAPMAERIEVLTNVQSIVCKRCSFSDLRLEGNGGAIRVGRESKGACTAWLVVEVCCFERCSGHAGGGVFFDGHGLLFMSSVGTECAARDGGALVSSRSVNLSVNLTSAVRTSGGSLDLAGGVQVVFGHNTSRCYNGGVVIREHDSLDFSFAELTAISLGRCLTLHSNAAPEVVRCVAVYDNVVGAILYVAGTYRVGDTTFRNNAPDVFVIFGPGGALMLIGCAMDVRTVSSAQEDTEFHRLIVADALPDRGHAAAPHLLGSENANINIALSPFDSSYSEVYVASGDFAETDSITVSSSETCSHVLPVSDEIATRVTLNSAVVTSRPLLYSEVYITSGDFTETDSITVSSSETCSHVLTVSDEIATRVTLNSAVVTSRRLLYSEVYSLSVRLNSGVLTSQSLQSSGGYTGSEPLRVSGTNTGTETMTISEHVTESSSMRTTLLPPKSEGYTLSTGLGISDVIDTKVIILWSALNVSNGLSLSGAYTESQDGPVVSEQLKTTGGLSLSGDVTISEPITESNWFPISRTLDDTRMVVTRRFPDSDSATVSGFLTRSDGLIVSEGYTFSAWHLASGQGAVSDAIAVSGLGTASSWPIPSGKEFSRMVANATGLVLSDRCSDSLRLASSDVWNPTGKIIISKEFSLSQLVWSGTRLTAVHLESAGDFHSDGYTLSNQEAASGIAVVSVGLSLSEAQTKSVGLSGSVQPVVSQTHEVTRLYDGSDLAIYSVGLPLSDTLGKSDALTLSAPVTASRSLTLSGDFPDSGDGTYSDVVVLSVWGTRSNNVTFSDVLMLSMVVNATKEGTPSEMLVFTKPLEFTKRLQATIVRGVSDNFTGSEPLTPSVGPDEGLSETIVILLSVLGSLLLLAIIGVLLWFFVKRREGTSTSSADQGSSTEEVSSDSAEVQVEGVRTFDVQPGAAPPTPSPDTHGSAPQATADRVTPQPPPEDGSESSYYSDSAPAPATAPAPPVPGPPQDDGYASSYYSDSAPAPAGAITAKSADSDTSSLDAGGPPPPPPGHQSEDSGSYTYSDSEPPAVIRARPAPETPTPGDDGSEYTYSESAPAARPPPPPVTPPPPSSAALPRPPPVTPPPRQPAAPPDPAAIESDYSYSDSTAPPPPPPVERTPPHAPTAEATEYSYTESTAPAPPPTQPPPGSGDYTYSDTYN